MSLNDEKYTLEITKKLETFKNAKEWPDFISLLTSLDSTIELYSLPYIPKLEFLCKRLNQCLNPLLPAGVHKKAFETYSIIFKIISEKELINNFGIITLGLLSFGINSRVLVMGSYLDLIDNFIIQLGEKVEPFTINILFSILPSMESESSEYYSKGLKMLQTFKEKINQKIFYNSLWKIFLCNCNVRLAVIFFMLNEDINYEIMASDKVLVIKALKEGLKSKDLLIITNTLNLIIFMFPLENSIFSNSLCSDLLEGMLEVFSRREQSLNKRVFKWLNITEENNNLIISKNILKSTLCKILKSRPSSFFKIFVTLSDKNNLTDFILEDLLFEVLIYIKSYKELEHSEFVILDKNKQMTQQFIIDISKNFITADLDRLWKTFYIEMKNPLMNKKSLSISDLSLNSSYSKSSLITDCNYILQIIDFCTECYNVFDDTVYSTHLPIFISFLLSHYESFDDVILLKFLNTNIGKVILKDQSNEECNNFFDLIDEFYTNENAKILKIIHPYFSMSISRYLFKYLDENNFKICIKFLINNSREYITKYFSWMITKSCKVLEGSLSLYKDISGLNGYLLFDELWSRFLISKDKKQIAHLIYNYNILFKRRYENRLIRKVNEINKQNICLFMNHIFEIENNDLFYFYNIFFLINCKISSQDPILISLIKSIDNFADLKNFIIKKHKESRLESDNFVYNNKPILSQIKGLLKLINNLLDNSEKFKCELKDTYKKVLVDNLLYLFLCDMPNEDLYENIRDIKIRCLKIIQYLIQSTIVTKDDINDLDFVHVVKLCIKYKNDPAFVIPTGELVKLNDDTTILSYYSSLISESCFYYFDLLSFIFSLDLKHIIIILPDIIINLKEDEYTFNIYKEVVSKMLQLNIFNFNWALTTKILIHKFINFCEQTNSEDDVIMTRNHINAIDCTSKLLFNSFSGYFIEYLINTDFSSRYFLILSFKDKLYSEILSSYTINQGKTFKFLIEIDSTCTYEQLFDIKSKYKLIYYQITNYRTFSDTYTFLYLLKTYTLFSDEHSQLLSTIYQTISFMQKSNITDTSLIDFLCNLEFDQKIKSALITFLGFFFNLIKNTDKTTKSYLLDKILILCNNQTITVKNMKGYLLEYLDSADFFFYRLNKKAYIYKQLIELELNIMDEYINKLESSFFVSQVSDINIKCNVLKRIAFLIFVNDYNKFVGFISKLIEICVNFIQHNSVQVRKRIWFLIKIICTKIEHSKLLPLFPIIFTEIISFLNKSKKENPEFSYIVKLIDLLFLINSTETFEFKNFCIGNQSTNLEDDSFYALPFFIKIYKKLIEGEEEVEIKRVNVTGKRKLYFLQKVVLPQDILVFFKISPIYYVLQDKKSLVIDFEMLEKSLVSEFHD